MPVETAAPESELIALYIIMFEAPPTFSQLADMVANAEKGMTTAQIAVDLAKQNGFLEAYPTSMGNDAFAEKLVNSLLADDASAETRDGVLVYFEVQLQGTVTRAELIARAVHALLSTPTESHLSSQTALENKIAVAKYFVDLEIALSPADSKRILLDVGQTAASVDAAKAAAGAELNALKLQLGSLEPADVASTLLEHLPSIASVYSISKSLGLNSAMLSTLLRIKTNDGNPIMSLTKAQINAYFADHGLDASALGVDVTAAGNFSTEAQLLTADADTYGGSEQAEHVNGLTGNDTLKGGAGNDVLLGGEGDDTLDGGLNRDKLDGGAGDDKLYAGTLLIQSIKVVETTGGYGSTTTEKVTVESFDDSAEWLFGGAGNDQLYGGYGSDYLEGGAGDDRLVGDYNYDATKLDAATTTELRTMLNDTLYGGAGADYLVGGRGNDTYLFNSLYGINDVAEGETIIDTGGLDTLKVLTSTDFSLLNGGDTSLGSTYLGIEQIVITSGETATFTAAQLAGSSLKINASGTVGAHLLVKGSTGSLDSYSSLTFTQFDSHNAFDSGVDTITFDLRETQGARLIGTSLNDTILGSSGLDVLSGGDGNDTINGGDGYDTINGGAGTDTLIGGGGNNTYVFYSGDVATGETITDTGGRDTIMMMSSTDFSLLNGGDTTFGSTGLRIEQIVINSGETATFTAAQLAGTFIKINALNQMGAHLLVKGGADSNDYRGLIFTQFDNNNAFDSGVDTITFDMSETQGWQQLVGTRLNDIILGGNGDNYLVGGDGDDTIEGRDGNDDIQGRDGNDTLKGGDGNDILWGGNGHDHLYGGLGSDILVGGASYYNSTGTATYHYSSASESTINNTASRATGVDQVYLTSSGIFDFTQDVSSVKRFIYEGELENNGDALLNQLDRVYQEAVAPSERAGIDALYIQLVDRSNGALLIDINNDDQITDQDLIIQIVGNVTSWSVVEGNVVLTTTTG